ncbi:MAG: 50S ribosomal protein L10 [Acidobacteria bacterium]|nr:50S ribosomal protein L10 [Acidobacteriota bacterium]
MNKAEKEQTVEYLSDQFRSIESAFLINYRGLKVVDATELRRKIREIDGRYVVVKNTLALRAAKQTKLEQLEDYFEGPTAVAYHPKDVVGLAKLLNEISKSNPSFVFKAALVEGKVVPASEIQAIASMPSKEVLLGKLAFLLKAPLQRLTTVLKAPVRDLGLVLKLVPKQGVQTN